MDEVMYAGGEGEDEFPFPGELSLRLGCATPICLFSYQTLFSGSQPASKQPVNPASQFLLFPLLMF